jgi:hypothetical protein
MQEEEKEKEEVIVLTDEVTPPYDGSKREIGFCDIEEDTKKECPQCPDKSKCQPIQMSQDKEWLLKKAEEEDGSCTSVGGLMNAINPALNGATEEYHREKILGKNGVWKKDNYIIGKRTPEDKQYCEPVSALDLHNTAEIRKYILAVEKFTTTKENRRSTDEAKYRLLKYILCYLAGTASVLWALYAGMINLTQ